MSFNLNAPWGAPDVAALLASVEDDRNWRIILDRNGTVSLLDATANETPFAFLHCYFETYMHGNGYVGSDAAADTRHVDDITQSLRRNWPSLVADAYINSYGD